MHQINEAKLSSYDEEDIINSVIRAMTASLTLRNVLETTPHLSLKSSHTVNSCRMKLLRIFRIFRKAMLKMSTFLLTLVFKNALLQLNSLIARLINSVLASLVPNLLHTTYGKCQTFCIQLMVSAKPSAYNLWYTTSKPNFAKII